MLLPLSFDVRDKPCLLIGGGQAALAKARLLLKAGAQLHLLAPGPVDAELQKLLDGPHRVQAEVAEGLLEQARACALDAVLCVVADANWPDAQAFSDYCFALNKPLNVVDQPALGSFAFPAIVDRSPISIAISSSGASPVLVRRLRERLETLIPGRLGRLAELAAEFRAQVHQTISDSALRRRFWETALSGSVAERVYSGRDEQARQELLKQLHAETPDPEGEVFLVGAGPGDPELLTLKALRLMQEADTVLYDRLVSKAVLEYVRRDARRIYVGKQRDAHTVPQEDINQLMIEHAQQGQRVLRLKGGDPFVFGRGGEEMEQLADAGIHFQLVPGVTAASGCASYAGIPLTHRELASSVRFLTGHMRDDGLQIRWQDCTDEQQTLVFYMAVHSLALICEQLIAHGRPADTPLAMIEQGTTPRQRSFVSRLSDAAELAKTHNLQPPCTVIVGKVVQLHEKLAWFGPANQVE